MTIVAVAGWVVAGGLGVLALALRWRLELVARADHELRGPLTALSLALETIRRGPAGRQAADALETQLDRARAGLADLAAARAGRRARSQPGRVALHELVRRAAAGWEPAARRAGRSVQLDWRAGPVTVRADRRRLAQVLGNLISNAVEHGEGGVQLRGRRAPGTVRIEVSDSGPGLGATPRPAAADRGRGLSIAAGAAEKAGGRLSVAPAGRGTTVALELPVEDR